MKDDYSPCPNCGSDRLYESPPISSGGGYAPDYLPGLGKFLVSARFTLVLCSECGLTRFFASEAARDNLRQSWKWKEL